MLEPFKAGWILITMKTDNVFIIHHLETNRFESDSNCIISLCLYHYSCGVDMLFFYSYTTDF